MSGKPRQAYPSSLTPAILRIHAQLHLPRYDHHFFLLQTAFLDFQLLSHYKEYTKYTTQKNITIVRDYAVLHDKTYIFHGTVVMYTNAILMIPVRFSPQYSLSLRLLLIPVTCQRTMDNFGQILECLLICKKVFKGHVDSSADTGVRQYNSPPPLPLSYSL